MIATHPPQTTPQAANWQAISAFAAGLAAITVLAGALFAFAGRVASLEAEVNGLKRQVQLTESIDRRLARIEGKLGISDGR